MKYPTVDCSLSRKIRKNDLPATVSWLLEGHSHYENLFPKLEKQLAETTGLFKGKERKALQEKIAGVQQEICRLGRLYRI